jgi:DNA polymerase III subunit beta
MDRSSSAAIAVSPFVDVPTPPDSGVSLAAKSGARVAVDRAALVDALAFVKASCETQSTMPILRCVRIASDDRGLTVETTDLYRATRDHVESSNESGEPFEVVTEHRALLAALKSIKAPVVTLYADKVSRGLAIEHANGRATIAGIDPSDYPPMPFAQEGATPFEPFNAETLATYMAAILPCVSTDETRAHLNSMCIEVVAGRVVTLVSTDGHRLAKVQIHPMAASTKPAQYLCPRLAALQIATLAKGKGGPVTLSVGRGPKSAGAATVLQATRGERTIACRLVDASFPPYGQVIPQASETRMTVGRAALTDGLKAMLPLTSERTGSIKLTVGPVTSIAPSDESGSHTLAATVEGKACKIGYNATYWLQWLASLPKKGGPDAVTVRMSGELDPMVSVCPLGDAELTWVCMPMRM